MSNNTMHKNSRICVLGAGAAGLSTAYYLQKRGYTQVTVLEKSERIGGKCDSLTYKGRAFDLGANYITSSYKEIRKMAREVGATMYTEGSLNAFNLKSGFGSILKAVTKNSSLLTVGLKVVSYIWKRWQLENIVSLDKPGFAHISAHPELTQPFSDWLEQNDLSELEVLFQIPITAMGYGHLDEIPTAYALTYMNLGTFIDLVMAAINPHILGWPKRFTEGYERFWQRISWKLNVLVGVDVHRITRGDVVTVECTIKEQQLNQVVEQKQTLEFDYIVLATPLSLDVIETYLHDLTGEEKTLFGQILLDPFVVVTYDSTGMEDLTAATFVLPSPKELGLPLVVTRQFDDNNLVEFYTRGDREGKIKRDTILANNQAFAKQVGGTMEPDYITYDDWPYFPHVSSADMQGDVDTNGVPKRNGFYDKLAAMQGKKRTFYVGGVMAFELVEPIVRYSKYVAETFFPRQ